MTDETLEILRALTPLCSLPRTCCALRRMRSVPYKVVCLVGMDEGKFPRQGTLPGFDWTAIAPRVGDKIPRDEGRLMLLEAILSARGESPSKRRERLARPIQRPPSADEQPTIEPTAG